MGVTGFDLGPDLARMGRQGMEFIASLNPKKHQTPQANEQTTQAKIGGDDVQVMDQAAKQLSAQVLQNPDDPALRNELGILYASVGEFSKSVEQLQKSVDLCQTQINALSINEQQLRAKGDYNGASKALVDRFRLSVQLSASHSSLARVFDQLGQHDRVVAQLEQLNKDITFGQMSTKGAGSKAITATAVTRKVSPEVLQLLATGEAMYQAQRYAEAIQVFNRAVMLDPLVVVAHQKLGMAAAMTGNYGLAVTHLETAAKLDPTDSKTHDSLGMTYQAMNEPDKGMAELEEALKINPKDGDAAYNLGNSYARLGKLDQACDWFAKAVKLNPRSAMAHNNFGTVLQLSERYQDAKVEFQQALSLAPDLASSHYGLALSLYNSKEYAPSIVEFKRALALNPSLVDAHNKIEQAYRKANLAANAGFGVN